ncbi:unnamed protein product, partial [Ixodes hexagonus]
NDVFSLPGLPDWGAPSALERNFENRDEDLSVASCVESLWSTKTAGATDVLDRMGQDIDHVVMSKLGLQVGTCLASGAPMPRSLPGLKAVFSADRAVSLYQAVTKTVRYRTASLATSSELKPGSGDNVSSVDPREPGGAPASWSARTTSSPDYKTGTTNFSSKDVDVQGASDSADNAPQIAHQLKVVPVDEDDICGESPIPKLFMELSEVSDPVSKFGADGEETHGGAEREAYDIDAAVAHEYGLGDTSPKSDGARDLQFALGDAQAVVTVFTNPEGYNQTSPPLRITCSGDYQELNCNALVYTLADDSNQFEDTTRYKKQAGRKDCDQEKANPDEHPPALIMTAKSGSSSQSSSYQSSEHDDNTASTFEDHDTPFLAKSADADRSSGILTIAEPFNAGPSEPYLTEQGSAEPDFFSGVKLDPNFTSTPILIEERLLTPPSHQETSTWPAFDVLQKQNDDYFQLFEPHQVIAGVEHKSSFMSGEVFESLNSGFPSSRKTTYNVGFSPKSSNASLNVQFASCTSIADNDSESSVGSFVTVTSDDDDEACDSDRSIGGISSTNLSGMVSPAFTESPLPAGSYNLYRCRDTFTFRHEQCDDVALERGIQRLTSEESPTTLGTSVSTTTLTSSVSVETASVETDGSQNLEEEKQSASFYSSTKSPDTEKHLNEDNLHSHQPCSPRARPSCRNSLHQLTPSSELSISLRSSLLSDDSFKTLPQDTASGYSSFRDSGPRPGTSTLQSPQQSFPSTSTTDTMTSPGLGSLRLQNEEGNFESGLSEDQTERFITSPAKSPAT